MTQNQRSNFCFQFQRVLFELNKPYHSEQLKLYENLMIIHRSHLDVFIFTLHGTKGDKQIVQQQVIKRNIYY